MKKKGLWVMVLVFFLVSLAAFSAPVSKKKGDYVVGISNSTFGNLWREKHVAETVAVANEYIKRG